jgi:RNA polymerase sigma factor (sigma-70 family)
MQYVRTMAGGGKGDDETLLQRFVHGRDEEAFAALVERYGPMVWAVCRRVVRHAQDSEDAFQATFFALARKASSIRKQAAVGSWLYGTAYRVARRVQSSYRPETLPEDQAGSDPATLERRNLCEVVDEEIMRLPQKYRAPIVACYLEGKTNEEAAQELSWPVGTVSGRLARARDLLKSRLARRGVGVPAAGVAAYLGTGAAPAAVPATLAETTCRGALAFLARSAMSGEGSARSAALAEATLKTMETTRMKAVVVVTLALATVGFGGPILYYLGTRNAAPELNSVQAAPASAVAVVQEMPADVLKAWQDAGFTITAWISPSDLTLRASIAGPGKKGDWPVFSPPGDFDKRSPWYRKSAKTLPMPPVPFGLSLQATANDEALKAVVGMKELRYLNLTGRRWTTEALKNLAGLPKLQILDTDASDACLKELAALKQLTHLTLHCDAFDPAVPQRNLFIVTDAGMKEVGAFKHLRSLGLHGANVSEAGVKELAALADLRKVDLYRTKMKSASLKQLSALTKLESLKLSRSDVADADLEALVAFKELKFLDLTQNFQVTNAAVKRIGELPQLETLVVSMTGIKNLDDMPRLKQLKTLDISHLPIVNLKPLAACKRLESVSMGPNIPDTEVEELRKASPGLRINNYRLFKPGATP